MPTAETEAEFIAWILGEAPAPLEARLTPAQRDRPPYVAPQDWPGPAADRPGLMLRDWQIAGEPVVIARGPVPALDWPAPIEPAHDIGPHDGPSGLRTVLGITAKRSAGLVGDGWSWRITRSVGLAPKTGPARWVSVELVALRLRDDVAHLGAVAVWERPVVSLGKTRPKVSLRREVPTCWTWRPAPSTWKATTVMSWPVARDGRPDDIPRAVPVAQLKALIRGPTGLA